ncbi:MAG: MATE family efflux transporter [Undibacterium sp.]|nr:MATE family efflux transporter [Opitutaceae bacterium]
MSRFKNYFAEVRPTLALAVPIIVGQVSQMLMGIADSVMIGQTGTVPLAASSFGGNVFGVFYVVGIGLMIPVAIFVARARGAGRPEECGEYLRHGLALALGFGVIETLAMVALGAQLHWFQQPPEVLAAVNPFFWLIGASITPVLVYLALRQFAEAMGRPWAPMFIMLGSVGLNVFLNWVFIWGKLGAPAMGLAGAGLATLISRVIGGWVIFEWLRRDPATRGAWPRRWWAPLERARLKEMLKLGLPASGILFFESGAFAAAAIMMGWLGAAPLAAHQIALSCVSTTFMVSLGLSMAAGMRVSGAVGAGETARLRPIGYSALALGVVISVFFMTVYFAAGRMVAGWFVDDAAVVALAAQLLVVAALFQVADGAQVIGAALLRGLTDVKLPAVITFVAYWLVAIPGGYVFGVHGKFGAVGIWMALAAGLGVAAVFLAWRFVRLTRLR